MTLDTPEGFKVLQAINAGKSHHAYLVIGNNEAVVNAASTIAQVYVCSEGQRPCGQCRACISTDARRHFDVRWIEPTGATLKIAQVRSIATDIYRQPLIAAHKVVIVVDADKMTVEAANAVLKVLEEPPEYGRLLLLTQRPQSILPTILSRCQEVRVGSEQAVDAQGTEDLVSDIMQVCSGNELEQLFSLTDTINKDRQTVVIVLRQLQKHLISLADQQPGMIGFCLQEVETSLQLIANNNANVRLTLDDLLLKLNSYLAQQ